MTESSKTFFKCLPFFFYYLKKKTFYFILLWIIQKRILVDPLRLVAERRKETRDLTKAAEAKW